MTPRLDPETMTAQWFLPVARRKDRAWRSRRTPLRFKRYFQRVEG